ncbi:MAG TPA: hypothetical protein VM124_00645 [Candidatus Limnocylindrales bacterium]|nr:hypothetical protein [Candidatus Limnocylindrales bacterium]
MTKTTLGSVGEFPPVPIDIDALGDRFHDIAGQVGRYYDRQRFVDQTEITFGHVSVKGLARVAGVIRTDSLKPVFKLDRSRYKLFVGEFRAYMGGSVLHEAATVDTIAETLFLGIGPAAAMIHEDLTTRLTSNKERTNIMRELFLSKQDISDLFVDIFGLDDTGNAFLASHFGDEQVQQINGQRAAYRYLFDALGGEIAGVSCGELVESARNALAAHIEDDGRFYQSAGALVFGMEEEVSQQTFVYGMPEWLVALACPMQPESFAMLRSPQWDNHEIE